MKNILENRIVVVTAGGHIPFGAGLEGIFDGADNFGRGADILLSTDGYNGFFMEDGLVPVRRADIDFLRGGSPAGASRDGHTIDELSDIISKAGNPNIIVMGGDDHLSKAAQLAKCEHRVVGWPKTQDNDFKGTYYTFGYPTTVRITSQFVAEGFNCAYTNSSIFVVPVFGRNTDWIAVGSAAYGGADLVIPGEKKYTFEFIADKVIEAYEANRQRYGRGFAVVVMSEAADFFEGLQKQDTDFIKNTLRGFYNEDPNGNVKLQPELLMMFFRKFFEGYTSKKGNTIKVQGQPVTYIPRNADRLVDPEYHYARECGAMAVQLLHGGNYGHMPALHENLQHSREGQLTVGSFPMSRIGDRRLLQETGFFDYTALSITPKFMRYAELMFRHPDRGILFKPYQRHIPALRKPALEPAA